MLIDSHCHLDFEDFAEDGINKIVERAKANGIDHIVTICTKIDNFDNILKIAQKYPNIDCSIGTHPHSARNKKEQKFSLQYIIEKVSKHKEIIGIGETGLDYYYNDPPYDEQINSLKKHLLVAVETELPIIIHTRNADEDTYKLLKEVQDSSGGKLTGVMHCFSSGKELAKQAIELGLYISVSGIITFKNAEELRDIIKYVPKERLLVETDAPYLTPVPNRGKRNEPAFVVETAKKLAEIKEVSLEEIATTTTENFYRLFKRAKKY